MPLSEKNQEEQEAQKTQEAINKQKETSKQIDRYTTINLAIIILFIFIITIMPFFFKNH
jgi:uncharacterized membrane protein YvbJ